MALLSGRENAMVRMGIWCVVQRAERLWLMRRAWRALWGAELPYSWQLCTPFHKELSPTISADGDQHLRPSQGHPYHRQGCGLMFQLCSVDKLRKGGRSSLVVA
jgi:hypothetical protein